jgi:uncharacterized protein (DUF488 family)
MVLDHWPGCNHGTVRADALSDSSTMTNRTAILTVGHSTRGSDELLTLLRGHGVELLADIRLIPRSRRHPWFGQEALAASLQEAGIGYVHLPELGGRRRPQPDSPNGGLRNEMFRGYADYMQTPPFEAGVARLLALAATRQTAVMCAEAVPWRCHRSLLADLLTARGVPVQHITGAGPAQPHALSTAARVEAGGVLYHPQAEQLRLEP